MVGREGAIEREERPGPARDGVVVVAEPVCDRPRAQDRERDSGARGGGSEPRAPGHAKDEGQRRDEHEDLECGAGERGRRSRCADDGESSGASARPTHARLRAPMRRTRQRRRARSPACGRGSRSPGTRAARPRSRGPRVGRTRERSSSTRPPRRRTAAPSPPRGPSRRRGRESLRSRAAPEVSGRAWTSGRPSASPTSGRSSRCRSRSRAQG